MVTAPVNDLKAAIMKKDKKAFEEGYDALTKACNDCHQATNFGFNVVQRPGDESVSEPGVHAEAVKRLADLGEGPPRAIGARW